MILLTDGETMLHLTLSHERGANASVAVALVTGPDQPAVFLKPDAASDEKSSDPEQIIVNVPDLETMGKGLVDDDPMREVSRDESGAEPLQKQIDEAKQRAATTALAGHRKHTPTPTSMALDISEFKTGVYMFEAGPFTTAAIARSKTAKSPFAIDFAKELDQNKQAWGRIDG